MIRKYYFINKFETNIIDKQDKQTVVIYRNYSSKIQDERKRNKLIKKAHNQNYELILTLLSKEKLNSKLIREYDIR